MRRVVITAAALAALAAPGAAEAHIQVRPAVAAPADAVLWTMLVPNERSQATTKVELAVPEGVIPFSFEDQPAWKREIVYASDKSVKSIRWTGRLASDGLAEFRFLASTPETEGPIEWKALQTYADGEIVRWIGPEDSGEPAAVTTISDSAPIENAGGEGGEPAGGQAPAPAAAPSPPAAVEDDGGGDTAALILAIAAAVLACAALVVSLRRRSG